MLRKETLLHFTLTGEGVVHGDVDLNSDESLVSRLSPKMSDVFSLLPIVISMQKKIRPLLLYFTHKRVERTYHFLKSNLLFSFFQIVHQQASSRSIAICSGSNVCSCSDGH
jgi:hypothetical protein